MKKLLLVAGLLVLVLLLSWWAKGANFNLMTMMQGFTQPQNAQIPTTTPGTTTAPTPLPVEILITVTPNGFVPDVIMIQPGTKITWVNKTPYTASINSNPESAYQPLNLRDFGQNGSVSLIFPKAGRYQYVNGKNPQQKGTIVVK